MAGAPADRAAGTATEAVPEPRRALLMKPCCIGDVLMATPLLAALRAAWPGAAIDWAVDAHSRPVVAGNPHLDALLDATGCVRGSLRARALAGLVRRVRRGTYDVAIVPDRSPVLALVCRAARVPLCVGLDSGGRGRTHHIRVPVAPGANTRHEAELYLDLARAMGLPVPREPRPTFVPSAAERAAAAAALAGIAGAERLAAVHPGGGVNPGMTLLEKRWPPERFARVADWLVSVGLRPVLLGSDDERALAARVLAGASPAVRQAARDLSGALSLGAAGAVIERSSLFLGNDSGLAHVAAGVGTPAVVVFGPTDPRRYGPLPGTGIAVAPAGEAVRSLGSARGSRAVESVPVGAVTEAIERLLQPGPGA